MAIATNDKNVFIATIALLLDDEEQQQKKHSTRSIWTRPWLLRRKTDGAYHTLFQELKKGDIEGFKG